MAGVTLVMTWDIREETQRTYVEFILGEFTPALQRLGVRIVEAWYTLAGAGPQVRVTGAIASAEAARALLASADFGRLCDRLLEYVENLHYRLSR